MDQVLWEIGYANMVMLLATIPVYEPEDPAEKKDEKPVKQFDFGDDVQSLGNFLNRLK